MYYLNHTRHTIRRINHSYLHKKGIWGSTFKTIRYHSITTDTIKPLDCQNNLNFKVPENWKYLTGIFFVVTPYNTSDADGQIASLGGVMVGFCTLHTNSRRQNPVQLPIRDWLPGDLFQVIGGVQTKIGVGYIDKFDFWPLWTELTQGTLIHAEVRNYLATQNLTVKIVLRGIQESKNF